MKYRPRDTKYMMYRIGEFSKLTKVSIKTLRHYDEIGLLRPERVDGFNRYRYYSTSQIALVTEIMDYREAGLPLDDIAKILSGGNRIEILREHLSRLGLEKESLENMMRTSTDLIEMAKNTYTVEIKDFPECIVYYRRGVIADFSKIAEFVVATGEECGKANPGLKCRDLCYVSYLDEEYKDKDITIEYAQETVTMGKETESVKFRNERPIKAVCVMHHGSYSKLGNAYAIAMKYVEENKLVTDGPAREQYIDGCWNCDDEEKYRTEVQIPVKG